MALRRIFKELADLKNDEKMGRMSVPCRIDVDEMDPFLWKVYFDLSIDGYLLDTVEVQIRFGSRYAFDPPVVRVITPGYRQIMICFNDWSPFMGMTSIIPHIYFSIIDLRYYQGSFDAEDYVEEKTEDYVEEKEEKDSPPQPSPESVAPLPSYHLKD